MIRKIKLIKREDRVTPVEVPVVIPITKPVPELCSEKNIQAVREMFRNDLQDLRKRALTVNDLWPNR